VIPFRNKVDESVIWSKKVLAKAKHWDFKNLFLGKLSIPKADEEFDELKDFGNKSKIIKLNLISC
jgi:hypothetical protein